MAKKKAEDIEVGNVDAFLERLSKDWKDKIINGDAFKDGDYKSISTSSYKLDWALGGILEGSIIEIYGENSVGKTTLALHIAACAAIQHDKHTFYFDLERKLRQAQIDMIGDLDKSKLHIIYPDTAEDTLNKMHEIVMTVPGSVLILDSVGGLLPEVEDAENAEKQTMGTVAKFCAKMIRKLTGHTNRNKNLLIFLNHKTASMQMYGPSDTVHGGKAISNRAAQRIEMSRAMSNLIKNNEDVIGQIVKCKIVKNNLKRPFITVEIPIIYGMGICKELDLYEFAEELGLIQKAGSYVSVMGGENERKADVMNKIATDEAFRNKLVDEVNKVAP